MRYIVAGLHAAGRSACMGLRKADPSAEIIGVDPSPEPVYSRPLISYALSGEMSAEAMIVAGEDFWTGLGVTLVREKAVRLEPDRARLTLASGKELSYDRLLLACGAKARPAGVGGSMTGEICYFRGRRDLSRIMARLRTGGVAAVLGGGLVGFKLTMGLLERGMTVHLIVSSPRPLSLNVDEHVGAWVGDRLRDTPGVTLATGTSVTAVNPGTARPLKLSLSTGNVLEVDLVAAGKGVIPETEWLEDSGLERDDGILADRWLRTSDERVYVAGDLAQAPDMVSGEPRINAVWPVAVEQGRLAALNMAGVKTPYAGTLAQNAIPVFGSRMISVGMVSPALTRDCDAVITGGPRGAYLKLVFREGRLVGAVGLDAPPRLGELAFAVRRRLRRRDIPDEWLDNPGNAAPLCAPGASLRQNARIW
ncbi:MAG: FAD-dependent oxidoreductase [Desulfovibrio sp.]|nr:FAD-dependent oxidoreductase [Desulfovibrio sp.]